MSVVARRRGCKNRNHGTGGVAMGLRRARKFSFDGQLAGGYLRLAGWLGMILMARREVRIDD